MKKLLAVVLFGCFSVSALAGTNIVKLTGKANYFDDDGEDAFLLKTTKGTVQLVRPWMDDKSFDVLYNANKRKGCVKITETNYTIKIRDVACPSVLKPIK